MAVFSFDSLNHPVPLMEGKMLHLSDNAAVRGPWMALDNKGIFEVSAQSRGLSMQPGHEGTGSGTRTTS